MSEASVFCAIRFVEQMLAEFASYGAWVTGEEDCVDYGAQRRDGRIVLAGNPMEDITDFVARDLPKGVGQHVGSTEGRKHKS